MGAYSYQFSKLHDQIITPSLQKVTVLVSVKLQNKFVFKKLIYKNINPLSLVARVQNILSTKLRGKR